MKKELNFQKRLINALTDAGCYVIVNDPTYENGIPDLTVIKKDRCMMIELKIENEGLRKEQLAFIRKYKGSIKIFIARNRDKRYCFNTNTPYTFEQFIKKIDCLFSHLDKIVPLRQK